MSSLTHQPDIGNWKNHYYLQTVSKSAGTTNGVRAKSISSTGKGILSLSLSLISQFLLIFAIFNSKFLNYALRSEVLPTKPNPQFFVLFGFLVLRFFLLRSHIQTLQLHLHLTTIASSFFFFELPQFSISFSRDLISPNFQKNTIECVISSHTNYTSTDLVGGLSVLKAF